MSLTIVAYAIAGVKVDIVVPKVEITRYNEITGEPYKKMVDGPSTAVCQGKVLFSNDTDYGRRLFEGDESPGGLMLFRNYRIDEGVFGVAVAKVRYEPGTAPIPTEIPDEVMSYCEDKGLDPDIHLFLYIS